MQQSQRGNRMSCQQLLECEGSAFAVWALVLGSIGEYCLTAGGTTLPAQAEIRRRLITGTTTSRGLAATATRISYRPQL